MITPEQTQKTLESIPGLTPPTLHHARQLWTKGNTMRQVLNVGAHRLIDAARTELETATGEDVLKTQGKILGIRLMLDAINQQGEV